MLAEANAAVALFERRLGIIRVHRNRLLSRLLMREHRKNWETVGEKAASKRPHKR